MVKKKEKSKAQPSAKQEEKKENVLTICAHNDDQIIGAGGTLIKYAKEGKEFFTIIFSYGESSHPHFKREVIVKERVLESRKSDKIMGGNGIMYLGIAEGKFPQGIIDKKLDKRIKKIIKEKKPIKIFTHSPDDPHPDHRACFHFTKNLLDNMNYKGDLFTFDVWNPIKIKDRDRPKMVVDVTDTFSTKIDAFKAHKSQKMTMISLMWSVYLKGVVNGFNNHCKYAEVFFKVR